MFQRRIVSLLSVLALLVLVFFPLTRDASAAPFMRDASAAPLTRDASAAPLSGPAQGQSLPSAQSFSPQANGGPDEYGYTWDEAVTQDWIDTSSGVDTGITSPSGPGA